MSAGNVRRRNVPKSDKDESDAAPAPSPDMKPTDVFKSLVGKTIVYLSIVALLAGGAYYYTSRLALDSESLYDGSDSLEPFVVIDMPGKGKGMIATRNIKQGEMVLREKPLFTVPMQITEEPGPLLLNALAELEPFERDIFYNLTYVNMPDDVAPGTTEYDEQLALAIFQTNSISAGHKAVGLFPQTARMNHGCSHAFNSIYSWRENEGVSVVHTLKAIKKGEELLTTYTNTKHPRDVRRNYLAKNYGFQCECASCSLPQEKSVESDLRLVKMTDLYKHFATWGNDTISGEECVKTAREIWKVGEEEGYWSERGRLASDACWVAAAHSDKQAAREWADLAAKWYRYELGADSEIVHAMEDISADPTSHRAWAKKAEETVGGPGRL